jgi:hypothetical protein
VREDTRDVVVTLAAQLRCVALLLLIAHRGRIPASYRELIEAVCKTSDELATRSVEFIDEVTR